MLKSKYEEVRTIKNLFNKGDFFSKSDIKHGYHHVNIDKAYHKYLSFSWPEDGVTKYYVFRVLVFGLTTALFVFIKVVKVLLGYWRGCGIRIFIFIDDFGGASTINRWFTVNDSQSFQRITANGHTFQSSDSSLIIGLYSSSYTLFTVSLTFTYFIIVIF